MYSTKPLLISFSVSWTCHTTNCTCQVPSPKRQQTALSHGWGAAHARSATGKTTYYFLDTSPSCTYWLVMSILGGGVA